jgi:predicted nucleic acid-binding protein
VLLPAAFELASAHQRTLCDALYVALAIAEACRFVTADRALYNSLAPSYPEIMLWIEDLP